MGRGFPVTASKKHKLNTRSSTESEVVGVDDFMPGILWTRNFMKAHDYDVVENIIFQDNKSAMVLENNGKTSSSKRKNHISIHYFFVTDRINKGEVSVAWCPTDDMTGDFSTKPNQGALFRRFRYLIMGVVAYPDLGPGKSKKVRTSTRSKSANVKGDQVNPSGTTWPHKCVGLPWIPDGQRTDAPANEDQNKDQVSTYLRRPQGNLYCKKHPSEVQQSLFRATYLQKPRVHLDCRTHLS